MQLIYRLYSYWVYFFMLIFSLVFMPIIWVLCSWPQTYKAANFLRIVWTYCSMFFAGIFIKSSGLENIDFNKNYIICFNHTSHLDIPIIIKIMSPNMIRFIAKAELAKIPLFGKFFRTIDFSVARENADDAKRVFSKVEEALQSGSTVAIAPEGGTSRNPPQLRDFKSGAFRLAINTKTEILPICILNNYKILPSHGKPRGWHIVKVIVHKPIPVEGLSINDYSKLSNEVYTIFKTDLEKAS